MTRNFRKETRAEAAGASVSRETWLYAQAVLGNAIPSDSPTEVEAQANCELVQWLREVSTVPESRLRGLMSEEARAIADREHFEWLADVTGNESQYRSPSRSTADAAESEDFAEWLVAITDVHEAEWNSAKHPRGGYPQNRGQFSPTGGSAGAVRRPSALRGLMDINAYAAALAGGIAPGGYQPGRLAAELSSAARIADEIADAAAAGLGTGAKAVVNGSVTAIKDVATLGLSASQLELIGVNKEDRDRGYDTAVAISTASGQVLVAVGTGGITSALSKGGSVARVASGALIAFDAAGNVVGVVQGVRDAAQNRLNLRNGAQIAGGLLGLGANLNTARALKQTVSKNFIPSNLTSNVDQFVATLPRKATPTKSPANLYEIKHTGPYNYTVSGGGAKFDIDGFQGSTILEAKFIDKPSISPFVPGSSIPDSVRARILKKVRDELTKIRTIIESESTPFKSVEIITNSTKAKTMFEAMLKDVSIPGTVRLQP